MIPPDFGPAFFIETALLYRRDRELPPARHRAFAATVAARAVYAQGSDHDEELRIVPSHPGYLHRKAGERDVYVPFNLALTIPKAEILIDIIVMAESVRLGYGHPICISGSATFLGRVKNSADLDFCEYYPSAQSTLAPAIQSKAGTSNSPYMVGVKCAATNIVLPRTDLGAHIERLLRSESSDATSTLKLDFVGVSPRLGIMPVTSVVIPVEPSAFERGEAQASFAHQEVVVCVTSPPRTLLRVEEFTRYLLWLVEDVERWISGPHAGETKAPLKSLKRMLSIFLLLGFDLAQEEIASIADALQEAPDLFDPVGEVISSLNDGTLARVVDDLRMAELRSLAPRDLAIVPESVLTSIHDAEPLDPEIVAVALDAARELAEGLFERIQDLFDDIGVGPT